MRTGTEGSQTVTFSLAKTVSWWCGTIMGAGATYLATITSHTPVKKAPVSYTNDHLELHVSASFTPACGCSELQTLSTRQLFQQRPVGHHQRYEMPPYLEELNNVMRPMQLCVIIVWKVSSKDLTLWSGVCLEAAGRDPRFCASLVRLETYLITLNITLNVNKLLTTYMLHDYKKETAYKQWNIFSVKRPED